VDGLGVSAVEVEGIVGHAQLPGVIGTEDRLPRVVEDVEHVVATAVQKPLQRRHPANLEILPLVDHDRVEPGTEPVDRRVQPVWQRMLEPIRRDGVRLLRQRPSLAPEVLGQLVERSHGQPTGLCRDLQGLVPQQVRERRVETDEQGIETLRCEPFRLLDRQQGLARPRPTDDRRTPDAPQRV
jgi:hypothetical protein